MKINPIVSTEKEDKGYMANISRNPLKVYYVQFLKGKK